MNDEQLPGPHNRFFFQTFSQIDRARDLIAAILPTHVSAKLDLPSLRIVSGSFIDDSLRMSQSDQLYEVDLHDTEQPIAVYLLFEHKSAPDRLMPFQLLKYMVRIWEQRLRDSSTLCPIVPLLLYHGEKAWNTSRSMRDVMAVREEFQRYVPEFAIELLDLSQTSDEQLRENANLKAFLLLLKYIRREELPERLPEILKLFAAIADQPSGLDSLKTVLIYLSNGTERIDRNQLLEAVVGTLHQQGE
jgi:predicted transposase/invertase (TIGR01784 family)